MTVKPRLQSPSRRAMPPGPQADRLRARDIAWRGGELKLVRIAGTHADRLNGKSRTVRLWRGRVARLTAAQLA